MSNLASMFQRLGAGCTLVYLADREDTPVFAESAHRVRAESLVDLAREIRAQVRKSDLVVVVGVWHPGFLLAMVAVLFRPRTRAVLVPTNSLMPWDWKKHRILKRLLAPGLWAITRRLDSIVYASSGERDQSRPRARRRGVVIPHAVQLDDSIARTGLDLGDDGDAPQVLHVGRINPQKDIELLIASIAKMGENAPTLTVVGGGDASYERALRLQATASKVHVEWLGHRPRSEALALMLRARLVVVTSRAENFCHVAAEAASLGTSVLLVDRVASASDLARSPVIQLVAPEPVALAAAIASHLANTEPSTDREARAHAEQEWSLDAYCRRWAGLLGDLFSAHPVDISRKAT